MKNKESKLVKFLPCLTRWATIALVALRAADVILWPWYALFIPLYAYGGFVVLCAAIVGISAVKDGR